MRSAPKNALCYCLLECLSYAFVVAAYFLFVLRFLAASILRLYEQNRPLYAALALALIIGQGLLLESFTRLLFGWVKPPREVK